MIFICHLLVFVLAAVLGGLITYSISCEKGAMWYTATLVGILIINYLSKVLFEKPIVDQLITPLWKWFQSSLKRSIIAVSVLFAACIAVSYGIYTSSLSYYNEVVDYHNDIVVEYSTKNVAPIPISVEQLGNNTPKEMMNPQIDDMTTDHRGNCLFFIGPAGIGKAVAMKNLIRSYGEESNWNSRSTSLIVIDLYKERDKKIQFEWKGGTNDGLPEVKTIMNTPENQGLFGWYAEKVSGDLSISQGELCDKKERYREAVLKWVNRRARTKNGLLFVVDGLDEVGAQSLKHLLLLTQATMKTISQTPNTKITIALLGRGEICHFASEEIRRLNAYVNNESDQVILLTHLINPLTLENKGTVEKRLQDSFYEVPNVTEDKKVKAISVWSDLLYGTKEIKPDPLITEVTGYVDGANQIATYLVNKELDDAIEFNSNEFRLWFYSKWWSRGYSKHRMPPFNSTNFKHKFARDLQKIQDSAERRLAFPVNGNNLSLTGFAVITPVRPFPNAVWIQEQFPSLTGTILLDAENSE